MRVLSFSYCFPSSVRPTWGVFVLQRLAALARLVRLEVASPVPVFPLLSRLRGGLPAPVEEHGGLAVHYPRWAYVPGLLKSLDGRLYARGVRRWFDAACRRHRPDLLDAHFVWPDGVGVSHLAQRAGLPYVITLRGKLLEHMQVPSHRSQCAEAMRGAAAVISVSGEMADVAAEMGVPRDRLHVIPNGVDLDRFAPRDRDGARRTLGLPPDGRIITTVAHLKATKGHGDLVEALAHLAADVRLVIVGGDLDRGAYRAQLTERIGELGLGNRVVLAGRQPYDRVPLYLAAADVVCLASHREGCPNVVLEGLASGRPVVATRVGAVPDLVVPGENGEIVPPRDPQRLADGLAAVLGRGWSPEAVRASRSVTSWDDVAERILAVFRHVTGHSDEAPAPGKRPASNSPETLKKGSTPRPASRNK